jgi:hypothetical protein
MLLSRRIKRIVAGVAGVAYLLCYSVGIAQASSVTPRAPEKAAMPSPCHEMMGNESGPSTERAGSRCHDIASLQGDHSVPAWSPAFIISVVEPFSPSVSSAAPFQPPSLYVKPPPHAILHCCLRN